MKPDPIKVGMIFLGAACTSLSFGIALLYFAWIGFRDAAYPLTANSQLRGLPARCVAVVVGVLGLIVVGFGVATLVFGVFRVRQLLTT